MGFIVDGFVNLMIVGVVVVGFFVFSFLVVCFIFWVFELDFSLVFVGYVDYEVDIVYVVVFVLVSLR